jgi:hypothetical protein
VRAQLGNDTWVYDLATNAWTQLPAAALGSPFRFMPQGSNSGDAYRSGAAWSIGVVLTVDERGDRLFAVGGYYPLYSFDAGSNVTCGMRQVPVSVVDLTTTLDPPGQPLQVGSGATGWQPVPTQDGPCYTVAQDQQFTWGVTAYNPLRDEIVMYSGTDGRWTMYGTSCWVLSMATRNWTSNSVCAPLNGPYLLYDTSVWVEAATASMWVVGGAYIDSSGWGRQYFLQQTLWRLDLATYEWSYHAEMATSPPSALQMYRPKLAVDDATRTVYAWGGIAATENEWLLFREVGFWNSWVDYPHSLAGSGWRQMNYYQPDNDSTLRDGATVYTFTWPLVEPAAADQWRREVAFGGLAVVAALWLCSTVACCWQTSAMWRKRADWMRVHRHRGLRRLTRGGAAGIALLAVAPDADRPADDEGPPVLHAVPEPSSGVEDVAVHMRSPFERTAHRVRDGDASRTGPAAAGGRAPSVGDQAWALAAWMERQAPTAASTADGSHSDNAGSELAAGALVYAWPESLDGAASATNRPPESAGRLPRDDGGGIAPADEWNSPLAATAHAISQVPNSMAATHAGGTMEQGHAAAGVGAATSGAPQPEDGVSTPAITAPQPTMPAACSNARPAAFPEWWVCTSALVIVVLWCFVTGRADRSAVDLAFAVTGTVLFGVQTGLWLWCRLAGTPPILIAAPRALVGAGLALSAACVALLAGPAAVLLPTSATNAATLSSGTGAFITLLLAVMGAVCACGLHTLCFWRLVVLRRVDVKV